MFEGFLLPIADLLCSPGRLPPFLAPLLTAAKLRFQVSQKDQDIAAVTEVEKTPRPPHQVRWQEQQAPPQVPSTSLPCYFAAQNIVQQKELLCARQN